MSTQRKKDGDNIWRVIRQDTHGNQFEMASNPAKEKAHSLADEFNAKGHKQTYWAQKEPLPPPPLWRV